MRTPSRAVVAATALMTVAAVAMAPQPTGFAAGSDAQDAANSSAVPGDRQSTKEKDNRKGVVAPTAAQQSRATALHARARWNRLGTPAVLTAGGSPLASGLAADPVQAARGYVAGNRDVLGLTERGAKALDVMTVASLGAGAVVVFRQRFGNLVAGHDGLLSVGVRDGKAWFVSSSLARDAAVPQPATMSASAAERAAAADAGVSNPTIMGTRLVAVPTPDRGARAAYQVTLGSNLSGAEPAAYTSYVDARDGSILIRENLVDSDTDNPDWQVFPSTPPVDYSSTDTRQRWCFADGPGCQEIVGTSASPNAWDIKSANGKPTQTTSGNNSFAVHNWFTNDPFKVGSELSTPSPTRDYNYRWSNQWRRESCSPAVFGTAARNDIDAARANLFAMHNRMHDWSYHLGFTENTFNMQDDNFKRGGKMNDPEQGNAQAGGITGGPPAFAARDNANQITPPDGHPPITNMYLWQPIAGSFYAPCVDGDYDMTVIGHEYTHAITNRMIAGPDMGLSSPQGMSESWSDLAAMEYLNEHGYAPAGVRAFTIGQYVTSDPIAGIRNYNMSNSPLNYSSVDYDFVGLQVHASGELWSATNFDIRSALIGRYGAGTAALQKSCANGQTPVTSCPGNRRWAQLMFDSYLLMANSANSMVDARDALLGADMIRFGGANQDLLWNAFAKRGLGEAALSNGAGDANPRPGFTSPFANEATVTFKPVDENGQAVPGAKLFVGDYQARAVPVADTDPATALTDKVSLVPGSYTFLAQAPGFGHARLGATSFTSGQAADLVVSMPHNLASSAGGATVTGNGVNLARIVDDDEATNWASLGSPVAGKQVTVDLAAGTQHVRRIQVSAQLRTPILTDPDPANPQSRFSALRQFRVLACTASAAITCSDPAQFQVVFTSPADAFPSVAPRPRAPELTIRSFDIPNTSATHLRLEVLTNQCTGAPAYAGEQDADPRANTDCATASPQAGNVRVAEFEAFTR